MKLKELCRLVEDARQELIVKTQGEKLVNAAMNDVSSRSMHIDAHDPVSVVQGLQKLDPTGNKMLPFLANKYIAREFRFEDGERVKNALVAFIKARPTLSNKDINQYKSLHDLYDATEKDNQPEYVSKKQQKRTAKEEGTEVVMKGPNFLVLKLLTGEAACFYASGTKWCTSSPQVFENYARQGDIYVILVKNPKGETRKFQFHYHSGQIMNEKDAPLTKTEVALLSSYPQWYEFVDMITQRHHHKIK